MGTIVVVTMGVVAVCAILGYLLVTRLSAHGGSRDGDAAGIAAQVLAWSDAYRGSSSRQHPPMDGSIELAPPTQDGGSG